ncbi:S-methyl-5-thioribose-1-phosphate isomerase [Halothermothrix orenii]|uniref:Methylthioribose-1-phosphate isomerase n=1 Tax=Halothermothrix orenii (strain H 168 / OCM 544 / DSM 9562) TaxID=373903 RepID=B8CZ78_HALOH|nr:S-methyl-5-thioribose-1-phosphate isomerase [Halothermothrix orenii]ACL70597.1 putative translation initiation factor, aIF-2BI family [Halothermothrix orenii H 168]
MYDTLKFEGDTLILIDQRKLPQKVEFFKCRDYRDVEFAIADMVVRGAPAIGAAGAYGVYLAASEFKNNSEEVFFKKVKEANKVLVKARPTAVNLFWAINRMEQAMKRNRNKPVSEILEILREEADNIAREDVETNQAIGKFGNEVIPQGATILTHCNAGALATVGYGTALGVIRAAHESGKNIKVYADETRPRLQGARLTAFELVEEGIPVTLIADSVAATLIRDGVIDVIVVGADRIASNGDTANKIGTFMLSELAVRFGVPLYIAAPVSTIDFDINDGSEIVIEERSPEEVTHIQGIQIAPDGVEVYNPAFDVTPAENITGIITEKGIIEPPYKEGIASLKSSQKKGDIDGQL